MPHNLNQTLKTRRQHFSQITIKEKSSLAKKKDKKTKKTPNIPSVTLRQKGLTDLKLWRPCFFHSHRQEQEKFPTDIKAASSKEASKIHLIETSNIYYLFQACLGAQSEGTLNGDFTASVPQAQPSPLGLCIPGPLKLPTQLQDSN